MSVRMMQIAIDVGFDGDQISGHAGDGAAPPNPFTGWLGLIGVLDGLLSAPGSGTAAPAASLCLGFATAEDASAFASSAAVREASVCGRPEIWVSHHDDPGGPMRAKRPWVQTGAVRREGNPTITPQTASMRSTGAEDSEEMMPYEN